MVVTNPSKQTTTAQTNPTVKRYHRLYGFWLTATCYHLVNANEVEACLYALQMCMHACIHVCVYIYVIFCQWICPLDQLCVEYNNPFTFLFFFSDLSTHQSASQETLQQLQEELKVAKCSMCQEKDQKISRLETRLHSQDAEIAALRCMLIVIWNVWTLLDIHL